MSSKTSHARALSRAALLTPLLVGAAQAAPATGAEPPPKSEHRESSSVAPALIGGQPVADALLVEALRDCSARGASMELLVCLEADYVPRWLLGREARARALDRTAHLSTRTAQLLFEALAARLARELPEPSAERVDALLAASRREFESPERARLFRILVGSEKDARALLAQLSGATTLEAFRKLAREHSLDKATSERGGDLGFVGPDGTTDVPELRVDPALAAAARSVLDGEFVPEPVAEGTGFAVVWRRGTLPARSTAPEDARRLVLERLRAEDVEAALRRVVEAGAPRVERHDALLERLPRRWSGGAAP